MTEVELRDVPDFPGYRVGDDGTVWTCWRRKGLGGRYGWARVLGPDWVAIVPRKDRRGRLHVKLCRGGVVHRFFVHQLVLLAFVGPCPEGMEACHFPDPDSANCRLSNLRWDTKKGNANDRVMHGTDPRGERNPRAILNEEKVREIRRRAAAGETHKTLAAEYGVGPTTIDAVVKRETWKGVADWDEIERVLCNGEGVR